MEVKMQYSKLGTILTGIAMVLLGILAFSNPTGVTLGLTLGVGWVLLVVGVIKLVSAFTSKNPTASSVDLYVGGLAFLLGLCMVISPGFFVAWIFILLGLYIIFAGVSVLFISNSARALSIPGAGGGIFGAILMMLLGCLVMSAPFTMANVAMIICAVSLVVSGVTNIVAGIKMKKD